MREPTDPLAAGNGQRDRQTEPQSSARVRRGMIIGGVVSVLVAGLVLQLARPDPPNLPDVIAGASVEDRRDAVALAERIDRRAREQGLRSRTRVYSDQVPEFSVTLFRARSLPDESQTEALDRLFRGVASELAYAAGVRAIESTGFTRPEVNGTPFVCTTTTPFQAMCIWRDGDLVGILLAFSDANESPLALAIASQTASALVNR